MIIVRNPEGMRGKLKNGVVTIGNFDGIHLGHREIFRRVRTIAAAIGGESVVVTFVPHPVKLFTSLKKLRLITTYAEKEGLVEASGIDYLLEIPFTEEFAALTARDFVSRILLDLIGTKHLVIGYDYKFGRNREGDVALLRQMGEEFGFTVHVLEPIGAEGEIYSSTRIRQMVGDGDVKGVVRLLGRHFFLDGTVIHGRHRGKGLGFPTANLATDNELIPKNGVYAVKVKIDNVMFDGACNIGSNPTFGNEETAIEVFIFNFTGDLYGRTLRVFYIDRIRDERRFADAYALQQAIQSDVDCCTEMLRNASVIEFHETNGVPLK
jgi:riboflavin kinase / FMN adenylyltransferase